MRCKTAYSSATQQSPSNVLLCSPTSAAHVAPVYAYFYMSAMLHQALPRLCTHRGPLQDKPLLSPAGLIQSRSESNLNFAVHCMLFLSQH
jgi:hypothetical protein